MRVRILATAAALLALTLSFSSLTSPAAELRLDVERAAVRHVGPQDEARLGVSELIARGRTIFLADWSEDDGAAPSSASLKSRAGRPRSTARPEVRSCAGCHHQPNGIAGGRGDLANVVSRMPPDLYGAGYLEMLARQVTADLRRTRDALPPGESAHLSSTGISFGRLSRTVTGAWITRHVEGLPPQSLASSGPADPPSLVIRPWQASGSGVSLRDLHNSALDRHFGIQSAERFGADTDADRDGVRNEVTRGDVTALTLFVATLPAPTRVLPADPAARESIAAGEQAFARAGCARCHIPSLRLARANWQYSEPGPYNPPRTATAAASTRVVTVDLVDERLPQPRLSPETPGAAFLDVPAFTDFKLHDITDPGDMSAAERLDLNRRWVSPTFVAGNRRFLTKRLWAAGNLPPYFHHGGFVTLKDAILAHAGEALGERQAFERLPAAVQQDVVRFLESLQVTPAREGDDERVLQQRASDGSQRGTTESR